MSAIGITFGAAIWGPALLLVSHSMPSSGLLLGRAAAQDEVVDQLHGGVVHLHVKRFDLVREVVVSPHRRHGDEETERRGAQRFSDTAGDRGETVAFWLSMPLKKKNASNADEPCRTARRTAPSNRWSPGPKDPRFISACTMATERSRPRLALRSLPRRKPAAKPTGIPKSPVANQPGNVALLVALGDGDCFVEFSVLECAGNLLHETGATACARCCTSGSGQS